MDGMNPIAHGFHVSMDGIESKKEDRHECLPSTKSSWEFYCAASTMMPMFLAPLERAMSRNDIVVS